MVISDCIEYLTGYAVNCDLTLRDENVNNGSLDITVTEGSALIKSNFAQGRKRVEIRDIAQCFCIKEYDFHCLKYKSAPSEKSLIFTLAR